MEIISKQDAIKKGLIFYYTGKPCKNGHVSERMVKGGSCRVCKNNLSKSHRENNRNEYNEYCRKKKREKYSKEKRREIYENNIEKEMYYAAKYRAKTKNIEFTITVEDVVIPKMCPVFGIPLDRRDRFHSPSLDRIDNNLGYVKGNVQVISSKANRLKNNGTVEEFKQILEYMRKL